ncbi:MAG: hypothetical protein CL893_04380 [Dehalococcoidia bacterium]|nr:hypothetical protein [Dehalococcoidia bacterium]|tara:strand:- start:7032 stop:7250 length:219 start_codon:yes stop_codon:yes gene_type:complete
MSDKVEYIYIELNDNYKIMKLSLLGDYNKDLINLKINSELLFRRIFPEKSLEKISNILFLTENELLDKVNKK